MSSAANIMNIIRSSQEVNDANARITKLNAQKQTRTRRENACHMQQHRDSRPRVLS